MSVIAVFGLVVFMLPGRCLGSSFLFDTINKHCLIGQIHRSLGGPDSTPSSELDVLDKTVNVLAYFSQRFLNEYPLKGQDRIDALVFEEKHKVNVPEAYYCALRWYFDASDNTEALILAKGWIDEYLPCAGLLVTLLKLTNKRQNFLLHVIQWIRCVDGAILKRSEQIFGNKSWITASDVKRATGESREPECFLHAIKLLTNQQSLIEALVISIRRVQEFKQLVIKASF